MHRLVVVGVAIVTFACSSPPISERCDGETLISEQERDEALVEVDRRICTESSKTCDDDGDGEARCRSFTPEEACGALYACGFVIRTAAGQQSLEGCVADLAVLLEQDPLAECMLNCMATAECAEPAMDACFLIRCEPPPDDGGGGGGGGGNCCRVCTTGKACGDSCIATSSTCETRGGCACNG